jgi:hypothetical protein
MVLLQNFYLFTASMNGKIQVWTSKEESAALPSQYSRTTLVWQATSLCLLCLPADHLPVAVCLCRASLIVSCTLVSATQSFFSTSNTAVYNGCMLVPERWARSLTHYVSKRNNCLIGNEGIYIFIKLNDLNFVGKHANHP